MINIISLHDFYVNALFGQIWTFDKGIDREIKSYL